MSYIVPAWLFEEIDDINFIKQNGIRFWQEEKTILKQNVTVFDFDSYENFNNAINTLYDKKLLESADSQDRAYASRSAASIFQSVRQIAMIQDYSSRVAAVLGLIAAVNTLYLINRQFGQRFISLTRSLI